MRHYGAVNQGAVCAIPGGMYRAAMAPVGDRASAFRSTEGGRFNRADSADDDKKDDDKEKESLPSDDSPTTGDDHKDDDRKDDDKEQEPVATHKTRRSWW